MTGGGGGSHGTDPVLARLLLEEITRHAASLAGAPSELDRRKAIHALKGSAGLAGEVALAEALARIERRLAAGEEAALGDARALLAEAGRALAEGRPIPGARWPVPPADLAVRPIDPAIGARYWAEMADRLERIDRALGGNVADAPAAAAAYREVHAMKGAALAVDDELTAWFCHGMEDRLRAGEQSDEAGRGALAELSRWRGVLGEMIAAPEHALEMLRASERRRTTHPPMDTLPLPPRRPDEAAEVEPRSAADPSLRVPTATLDRLFERVRQLDQSRAYMGEGAALAHGMARQARQLRHSLAEALRLIGPPRPWGAPAAAIRRIASAAQEIGGFGEGLDRGAARLKEAAHEVRSEAAAAHGALAEMRTTNVNWLFDRVAGAVTAQARREGREVRITVTGGDAPIERRAAELLVDPVLQLARNAVTHGIEPAAVRALRGKPRVGTIRLGAEPRGSGLRLRIEDDGAGVDVADVRGRAVATGTISADVADAADDPTLLALLFVPGFTTRDRADLLAGRGVGLDVALEAVRRLGGTIRLTSQRGAGLTATIDVPLERGLVKVLWLEAGGRAYAIPVQHARRVVLGREDDARAAVSLDTCVRGRPGARPAEGVASRTAFAIELASVRGEAAPLLIGVDGVGDVEEVALRGISPVVATAGPYAGAIVRGGELRLCLDAHALADMVALARPGNS